MKDHEWEALETGDGVKYVGGDDPERHNVYQVMQIREGIVYAVRIIERRQLGSSAQAAATESVEIRINSDDWVYMRMRPKIALSGGFIVKRAETGEETYEKCPTATTPGKPRDAKLKRGLPTKTEGLNT